jgi:hypothetical protein
MSRADELIALATAAVFAEGGEVAEVPDRTEPNDVKPKGTTDEALDAVCQELLVPDTIRRFIERANDRSKGHQALVRALVQAQYGDEAVLRLVRLHEPSVVKYGNRLDAEVKRSIDKAKADLAAQPAGDEAASAWAPVDLRRAWDGDLHTRHAAVLRRVDGVAVFAPGLNYVFGDSGDGKSMLVLLGALQVLTDGGHVVWITYEDPNEYEIVKRLKLFGATTSMLDRLAVIIATDTLDEGVPIIAAMVRARRTALVVLDSVGEALAVSGVDEDRDAQFGPWARGTVRRLLDLAASTDWTADQSPPNEHVAVLPIDHSTKSKDNPHFPSGSKRKRAMLTGTMVSLNVRQPFGIGRAGRVQLICAKDRTGRFVRGEIVAEVSIDATTTPYLWEISAPPNGATMAQVGTRRKADDRVMQALELAGDECDSHSIHRAVNATDNKLPGEGDLSHGTVQNALTRLHKRPGVSAVRVPTGVGKATKVLYRLTDHESDQGGTGDHA